MSCACGEKGLCRLASLLCAAGAASAGWAQSGTVSERQFFEDLPAVLTASRLPTPQHEVPGAVTVIDQQLIRATGYRDITRLLRLVPGFNVVQSRGHTPSVAYHGLNNDFPQNTMMQVLIDGRSVFSPSLFSGADWSGLPITIDEIERIEVVRGTNQVAYGSNAFLGVVNIITQHSIQDPGVLARYQSGEHHAREGVLRYGGRAGALSYRLSAERARDSGFNHLSDDSERGIATFRADYTLNPRDEINFFAGVNDARRTLGFPDSPDVVRIADTTSSFGYARWRRIPKPGEELSVGYYHNTDDWNETQGVVGFPISVDLSRTGYRDNVDFQHILSPSAATRLVWGVEARRDSVKSALLEAGEASSDLFRVFGNLEWRMAPGFLINAGAMAEDYSGKEPRVAPRLFANWTVAHGQTLRAGISRAYREPSIGEKDIALRVFAGSQLIQGLLGGGNLTAEEITATELGWVGMFSWLDTTIDVRLFDERLNNLINTATQPSGIVVFQNVNSPVKVQGIEYQLKLKPWRQADLLVSHAMLTIDNDIDPTLEQSAPGYTASISWLQRWPAGLSSTVTYYTVGPYSWLPTGTLLPSSQYWDARVAYTFKALGTPVELAIGAINLGGKRSEFRLNETFAPADVIGPTAYASIRLGL